MNNIKYIVLDVDGTLTDGTIYYDDTGRETKCFSVKDGLAIVNAGKCGLQFIVCTGRKSEIVERRMKELHVSYVFQGVKRKTEFLDEFIVKNGVQYSQMAYIGDDLNDYEAMKKCAFKACPQDACAEIKKIADYIAPACGGRGAVRECLEYILKKQGLWEQFLKEAIG